MWLCMYACVFDSSFAVSWADEMVWVMHRIRPINVTSSVELKVEVNSSVYM